MKKHGLFKILLIIIFLLVVLSYFVPNRTSEIAYLGLGDVFINGIQSFYYFFDTVVFVLVIGGFYGVLSNTLAYKKFLNNIVAKVKPQSKKFIFGTVIVFALITALTGLTMPLLVFVPLVVSIILLLGYDKLVALSSTVGAIAIGFIGGLFITFKDPTSSYSVNFTSFEKFCSIDNFFVNIFPKILLLVVACGLFIYYINRHIKSVEAKKVKYELGSDNDLLVSEVKGNYKDIKTWPVVLVLSLMIILIVLGFVPWAAFNDDLGIKYAVLRWVFTLILGLIFIPVIFDVIKRIKKEKFNSTILVELISLVVTLGLIVLLQVFTLNFDKLHTTVTNFKIGEFTVFNNVISSNFAAFGQWATLGNYMMIIILMLLSVIVTKFACKVKWNDVFDNFLSGTKKMLPAAFIAIIAYTILVCAYNNGFMEHLISSANESMGGLNLAMASLFTVLGSVLNVDLFYTAVGIFKPIFDTFSDDAMFPVLAMTFQSLFGLVMLVGPTSLILIIGLTYLDIPYTTWLKYIWRFLLELIILVFVILLIVTVI